MLRGSQDLSSPMNAEKKTLIPSLNPPPPREDARGLSRKCVLRIPSVS